jgi:hypothetical protein
MNEQRKHRATEYVKEVLRGLPFSQELLVDIGKIILHAYFRGQADLQAELAEQQQN